MESLEITIEVKQIYGKDTFYPFCDKAKAFLSLTGRKTFYQSDLSVIKSLGYVIHVNHPFFNFQN